MKKPRRIRSKPIATGLKPPPARVPRKQKSTADLLAFQRFMAHALYRPLTADYTTQPVWFDGRPIEEVAAEFIKPNDRLTSLERLQIYNRCYWYRLIDIVFEDCPGLRAALGDKKFGKLVDAYLAKYPSRSFSLRNLCQRLPQFIQEEPRYTAPRTALALDLARFEWAQTVAFDGDAQPKLTADDIADSPPARLRLRLQPYITLLDLGWPLDDYVIAVKQGQSFRSDASNTPDAESHTIAPELDTVPIPKRQRTCLAVHRLDNLMYYKRLDPRAFRILTALDAGQTLVDAVAAAGRGTKAEDVQEWFSTWMELGWFCKR